MDKGQEHSTMTIEHTGVPLKAYIGVKIIRAGPMDRASAIAEGYARVAPGTLLPAEDNVPGYKVVYPDGYTSWSPKDVFDAHYRLVSAGEMHLVGMPGT